MYQSAYRRVHLTETVLLKVHTDITGALDEGSMTALIIHDLSAAVEITNQPILVKRLELSLGFKGKALTWLKSYLSDRTQCVSVADKTSPDHVFGVPQGSVLGPWN